MKTEKIMHLFHMIEIKFHNICCFCKMNSFKVELELSLANNKPNRLMFQSNLM